MVSCPFREKKGGWSLKSRCIQDNILCFIDIICRNYTRSYDIQSFYYPDVGVIFENIFYLVTSDNEIIYSWAGENMDIVASSIISTYDVDKTQNSILKIP